MTDQSAPMIELRSTSWTDTEGDGSRLLATIVINGCSLHLEAFAVESCGGVQVAVTCDDDLATITRWSVPKAPVETVEIGDREYVLIASPYGA